MAMDHGIVKIIIKALDGTLLTKQEIIQLLSVKNLSPEAFAIQQAGRQFTSELNDGFAEVHAHVGLDAAPCPMNCQYCAFAEVNGVFTEKVTHPVEKIIQDALDLEEAGANAIYLVTTVLYGRKAFLETAARVKEAMKTDVPLVANIPDFGPDYARELANIGVSGIYHVIRLDEGVYTQCKPEMRIKTMEAARDAGLSVGNCIEPIGPEHSPEAIADLIITAREIGVTFSGAMRRTTVAGSVFEQFGDISFGRLATYAGAIALGTGPDVKGNCTHEPSQLCAQAGANIMWASRGTDPRDTTAETTRGYSVAQVRDMWWETDWKVWEGPSRYYG
ncbi:MAG: radical SAM protein [Eggerthellaceae bacterium]|nr:radical SAM protein [Eggerthellaceae bacterium]